MRDKKRRVRVGIDATPMLVAQRTGIERYATALIRELSALYPTLADIQLTIYLHSGNPYASSDHLREAEQILQQGGIPYRVHRLRRGYGGVLSAYAVWDRLDLLHMLPRARPWLSSCPYSLTIYDIKSVGLSEAGRQIERASLAEHEKKVIQDAAGIITISDSTARDLTTEFGNSLKAFTKTIHLGVDEAYFKGQEQAEAVRRKYGLERYIFFIGTLQYRKNLPRLIEAFALVKQEYQIPHKLVLAGRDGWGAEQVYQAVKDFTVADSILFPGYIPESDLPGLYAGADLFVYPSLHEGFGIPLLEAMAAGTVVYTSNLFSIPEVAGDAVIYIDPYDVDGMAQGLWQAISNEIVRYDLIEKGKHRAEKFTWQHMAFETLNFFRRLKEKS